MSEYADPTHEWGVEDHEGMSRRVNERREGKDCDDIQEFTE